MDIGTTAVAVTSIAAARKILEPFFAKLMGAVADGQANKITDWYNGRRAVNLAIVVAKAQERAKNKGLDPSEIPLKVIHPMLEKASLEEEPDLQEKWANLLAKSVLPRSPDAIEPAFVSILSQLTSRQAKFLDALYDFMATNNVGVTPSLSRPGGYPSETMLSVYATAGLSRRKDLATFTYGHPDEVVADYQADLQEFNQTFDALRRESLIRESTRATAAANANDGLPSSLRTRPTLTGIEVVYTLSALGLAFVRACKPPDVP